MVIVRRMVFDSANPHLDLLLQRSEGPRQVLGGGGRELDGETTLGAVAWKTKEKRQKHEVVPDFQNTFSALNTDTERNQAVTRQTETLPSARFFSISSSSV